jgi:hypothetical protein
MIKFLNPLRFNKIMKTYSAKDVLEVYYPARYDLEGCNCIGCIVEFKDKSLGKLIGVPNRNSCELEFRDGGNLEKVILEGVGPKDFFKHYYNQRENGTLQFISDYESSKKDSRNVSNKDSQELSNEYAQATAI